MVSLMDDDPCGLANNKGAPPPKVGVGIGGNMTMIPLSCTKIVFISIKHTPPPKKKKKLVGLGITSYKKVVAIRSGNCFVNIEETQRNK